MKPVQSLEQFRELIHEKKEQVKILKKNSVLLPATVEKYISENRMYFENYDCGIAFFVDEGKYYLLFYYWDQEARFADFSREKPILAEELLINAEQSAPELQEDGFLTDAGFRLYRRNLQVEIDLRKQEFEPEEYWENRLKSHNLRLNFDCAPETFERAVKLWDRHLKMTDIPLDHRSFHEGDHLLSVQSESGETAAVHWWRNSQRASEGRHTVTDPAYYRQGLAFTMLNIWCILVRKQGIARGFTWISDENEKSLALYRKTGFFTNGRVSIQYIK